MAKEAKEAILLHFGDRKISLVDLIEGVLIVYGDTNDKGQKSLGEVQLDEILNDLLTKDGKDLVYWLHMTPSSREELVWEYHTKEASRI